MRDTDRGALEDHTQATERFDLGPLRLELGGVAHRGREDDREKLDRGHVLLDEGILLVPDDLQYTDRSLAVAKWDNDHRANAVPAGALAVSARVVLEVVGDRGLVVQKRPAGEAAQLEPTPPELIVAGRPVAEAGIGTKAEPIALQHHHRDPVATHQPLCPPADQVHDGLEIEVRCSDISLDLDDLCEPLGVVAQRELGELALGDVLEHCDRRPSRPVAANVLDDDPAPDRLAVATDVALLNVVPLALLLIELLAEDARAAIVAVGPDLQVFRRNFLGRASEHPDQRRIDLDHA